MLIVKTPDGRLTWLQAIGSRRKDSVSGGIPAAFGPGFPAAFRPPAFASRAFLRPLGDHASLTVGLPADNPPDPIGVATFRMR